MSDVKYENSCNDIDYRLAELLGESVGEYMVLYADGQKMDFVGTPSYSEEGMEQLQKEVDALNDRSDQKVWFDFWARWGAYFVSKLGVSAEVDVLTYHPEFEIRVHRVVGGFSEFPHVAIKLLAKVDERLSYWSVEKDASREDSYLCRLWGVDGNHYTVTSEHMADAVAKCVLQLVEGGIEEKG